MRPTIRGSDVFVKEDLRAIIDSLDIAARHQPSGCWRDGWLAATNAVRTAIGIDVEQPEIVTVHEITEYRHERIEQRRPAPPAEPAPRFAIRGEREAWPPLAQPSTTSIQSTMAAPANMTGDDVNITLFNTEKGRLVAREVGYGWIGNDGYTAFWNASDWQQVNADEARAMGHLVPDNWLVLMRHAYAASQRRQLAANDRRLLR